MFPSKFNLTEEQDEKLKYFFHEQLRREYFLGLSGVLLVLKGHPQHYE